MNHIYFTGCGAAQPGDFVFDIPKGYDCYLLLITNTPALFYAEILSSIKYDMPQAGKPTEMIRYALHRIKPSSDIFLSLYGIRSDLAARQDNSAIFQFLYILFSMLRDDVFHHRVSSHSYELLMLRRQISNNPQPAWLM